MCKTRKEMQSLIDSSRKSLGDAEERVCQRNKLIKDLRKENDDLKARIVDLENNVEFLVNNLSAKKRASLNLDKQN